MLDPVSRNRIFEVLAKLKAEENNTIIVIEHNLENLLPLADQMVLMVDGALLLKDETQAFFQQSKMLLEKGVYPPGAMHFFHELQMKNFYQGRYPLTVTQGRDLLREITGS